MINMVVRRVKIILSWLLALLLVFLLASGAWWLMTVV